MTQISMNKTITLTKDIQIPQLGFGTSGLKELAQASVLHALRTGYRHIDTADIYETHTAVGAGLRESGIPRDEVFITTKLWRHSVTADQVAPAVERFLNELGTDYIDLLLIHWPREEAEPEETLPAMEAVRQSGKVRALGVSNFDVALLERSLKTGVQVTNNQIKYNLEVRPDDVVAFCKANGVTVTAYSPIRSLGSPAAQALLSDLGPRYGASPQQVALAWLLGKGLIPIPRSTKPENIEANYRAQAIELSAEDAKALEQAV
ncbi:MAG: aldo/keto reductase [Anaerolineales bacterium]|nr:MAG: aldo/keto reductase [Anaerolineales bacterium]